MRVHIRHQGKLVLSDVIFANTFWSRLCGYMFRKTPHASAILFEPANAMQTTFMHFDLDIIFLTRDNEVVKVLRNVRPWRHTWFYPKVRKALEIPSGTLKGEIREGEKLEVDQCPVGASMRSSRKNAANSERPESPDFE